MMTSHTTQRSFLSFVFGQSHLWKFLHGLGEAMPAKTARFKCCVHLYHCNASNVVSDVYVKTVSSSIIKKSGCCILGIACYSTESCCTFVTVGLKYEDRIFISNRGAFRRKLRKLWELHSSFRL